MDRLYSHDVYGAVRTQSGSSANKFKYVAGVGHPTDEESGLIYMRARYYDPQVGRFVSQDPGQNGGNWYWYADGNPANRIDSSGESAEEDGAALAFVVWLLGNAVRGLYLGIRYLAKAWADHMLANAIPNEDVVNMMQRWRLQAEALAQFNLGMSLVNTSLALIIIAYAIIYSVFMEEDREIA